MGGGRAGGSGQHSPGSGGPRWHDGGPRGYFHGPRGHIIVGGGFYDPFWGPYYPYGYAYPYGYGYPDSPYAYSPTDAGSVKTEVTPKVTEVFVDGYYAGVADDFNGTFQRLHAATGGHALTLHLEGYRTVTENVYVRPDSTVKVTETMEKLAPGEVSEPVPSPAPPDGGSAPQ